MFHNNYAYILFGYEDKSRLSRVYELGAHVTTNDLRFKYNCRNCSSYKLFTVLTE